MRDFLCALGFMLVISAPVLSSADQFTAGGQEPALQDSQPAPAPLNTGENLALEHEEATRIDAQRQELNRLKQQLGQMQDLLNVLQQPPQEQVHTDTWRTFHAPTSSGQSIATPSFAMPIDDTFVAEDQMEAMIKRVLPGLRRPGFPLRVSDVAVNTRGAVVIDSTRLDPAAQGLFLPSAIPAEGEPFFGTGWRSTVQGQGSSVSLSWLASVGATPLFGAVRLEVSTATVNQFDIFTPQAWLQWDRFTFGITDSTFTDTDVVPDTVDINGPNSRAWIRGGQPQIRYRLVEPFDTKSDPSGAYVNTSVEMPISDVYAPAGMGYSSFAATPDIVVAGRYQEGEWAKNPCHGGRVYDEWWHVQCAGLFRSLGVERSDDSVRENAFGWGAQLTTRYTIFRDCELTDYAFASATVGEGIGRYFNDLHLVSAIYDAAYDNVVNDLTPLPVVAWFAAYQHEWTPHLRSTAVFSQIQLDSRQIPGGTASLYESGDYISCNVMYHHEPCTTDKKTGDKIEHNFFAGVEYLYGQKDNLVGGSGDAHRLMFVIAASK